MRSRTSLFAVVFGFGMMSLLGACGGAEGESQFDPNDPKGNLFGNDDMAGGGSSGGGGDFRDVNEILNAGCATATSNAARQPVYMLVVLDGSGSMDKDNKWKAVVPALDKFFDNLKAEADPSFAVGLTVFSDKLDPTAGKGPYPTVEVPIGFIDAPKAAALRTRIDSTAPKGSTPTFAALSGQYPMLSAFSPASPLLPNGKKVLVFMTDGVPNPNPDVQQPASLKLAADEFKKGTTTFAVGIGNITPADTANYDPKFMGALAMAGGAPNAGCDPNNATDAAKMCHFQVTPGTKTALELEKDFVDAINKIRGAVASCEYTLDKSNGETDPSRVNVIFTNGKGDSMLVPESSADGWTYDNPTSPSKVIMHGGACDTAKADPAGKVKIVLGCKSVVK